MPCKSILSNLPSAAWYYIFGSINLVIALSATVENSLALFALIWYKDMHSRSNRIIVSLAATDLLVGLTIAPLQAAELLVPGLHKNCAVDQARRILSAILVEASTFSIAAISYDRYVRLTRLNNYKLHMTRRKINILIITSWLIPVCLPVLRYIDETETIYVTACVSIMIGVLVAIIIFYIMILSTLKRKSSWRSQNPEIEKRQMQILKCVVKIISCYILMVFPMTAGLLALKAEMHPEVRGAIYNTVTTLTMLNSTANPVIYYFSTPNFQIIFKRLWHLDLKRSARGRSFDSNITESESAGNTTTVSKMSMAAKNYFTNQ